MSRRKRKKPRILLITPEIASVPPGMPRSVDNVVAKAGGMADVTAAVVASLFELGADVHVALPNYRKVFAAGADDLTDRPLTTYRSRLPDKRLHFAEDSIFYYRSSVYGGDVGKLALRFQREIINRIVPEVEPDLIHCNDWTTGLIPAIARTTGVPTLFTAHNIHTYEATLDQIEDAGIPVRDFFRHLYFTELPRDYESSRKSNRVNMLASGLFAAHYVNTVSPTFLEEIVEGVHPFVPDPVRNEIRHKHAAGCAFGILNSPPEHYDPQTDASLVRTYGPGTASEARRINKAEFQKRLGLPVNAEAPLFFWPSRLDPVQKGCDLLAEVLPLYTSSSDKVQFAVVADGPYAEALRATLRRIGSANIAFVAFSERLSRLGFGGADFVLMPSLFEPCGLPQMIGSIYGALPVVRETGGLKDTVDHIELEGEAAGTTGNGFVFKTYDANGFRWAIDQARLFQRCTQSWKDEVVERVMSESRARFSQEATAKAYFELYERALERPLVEQEHQGTEARGA
ncbi:MAG: glycogen synthase [Spirochaetales bacterium]